MFYIGAVWERLIPQRMPGTFIIWNAWYIYNLEYAWYIYISLFSRQAVTTVDAENRKQDR